MLADRSAVIFFGERRFVVVCRFIVRFRCWRFRIGIRFAIRCRHSAYLVRGRELFLDPGDNVRAGHAFGLTVG